MEAIKGDTRGLDYSSFDVGLNPQHGLSSP